MKEKFKILIVDDEDVIRAMLSQQLTAEGYSVVDVPSGEEALEIFRIDPDHLVITDIRMGGMSGIQLLEEIKKLDPDAVVVMITSYASLDSAITTMRAGAYDYLCKPFDDLDLVSAVVRRAMTKIGLLHENRALLEELERTNIRIEQSNEALRELAISDALTGLFNHRHFRDSLDRELARAERYVRPLCLILADVDHFKDYNDTQGTQAGDAALKTLADIITARLRVVDSSARYGGEEFAILLTETDMKGGKKVAEAIRVQVEDHPFEGGDSQPLGMFSVSIGVAAFPADAQESSVLLEKAENALSRAKYQGRNKIVCASDPE